MPREPGNEVERLQRFISPCGVLQSERTMVLATVYAGSLSAGKSTDTARHAVDEFLLMLDGVRENFEPSYS